MTAATAPQLGGQGRAGGGDSRGPGNREATGARERLTGAEWGGLLAQPTLHARHGHSSCCWAMRHVDPHGALVSGPRKTPPPTREGGGKGASAGTLCLGGKWKVSNRFQILFATGGQPVERLLRERNGSISRNFLHFSVKLTLGRGQRGASALGTKEKLGRRAIPGEGVSRQQLTSPHETFLARGGRLLVLCALRHARL